MAFLVNPNVKMHIFLLVFLVVVSSTTATVAATSSVAAVVASHHRRTLHRPFFPQDAPILPPAQSPAPAVSPTALPPSPPPPPLPLPPTLNVPFLSTPAASPPNDDQPFFHTIPSPPPPPAPLPPSSSSSSSTASFPANISSLSLPASPKPKRASSKLVPVVVSLAIAAVIVLFVVLVLRIQKRKRNYGDSEPFSDEKPPINDGLFSAAVKSTGNGNNSYNRIPKLNRPSQTSSEFLYLGTLVNSHGGPGTGIGNGIDGTEDSNLPKIASPELRPLPPLTGGGQSVMQNAGYETSELESRDEEFYSPRASDTGIAGGRAAATGGSDGLGSSSSYTSSSSGSPARSISLSISPPASLSPRNSRMKSPDLVAIHTAPPPSRPAPPPPPPQPARRRHPVAIPSPDVGLSKDSLESSPRFSNSSSELNFPPAKIPPPPPPPVKQPDVTPPAPVTRLNPPVLIRPSRPAPVTVTVSTHQAHIPPIEMSPENQENLETTTLKPKLKPLHWDKVRASSDRDMVWDHLKSSSFKLNEEMIETLFIVKPPNPSNPNEKSPVKGSILRAPIDHENQVLDPKRSQNISIALRALNVTAEDVCDALLEGNVDAIGTELLESLLKMVPTKEEERKLKDYRDDSPYKLGPAEKFLKTVLNVPFAFKRISAMLYVSGFDSEVEYLKRSFQTLDAACEELRNNRMFLKLLEAVLKTGNRMNVGTNRGDAQAFKLDTLLKLIDVKSADGKTTLLHFVVQEITRTEGARLTNPTTPTTNQTTKPANGLQTISNLCSELSNVKKAAAMDYEVLKGDVTRLSNGIVDAIDVVKLLEGTKFSDSMNQFLNIAQQEVIKIQVQERDTLCLVKEITEYFHGNSAKEEAHPLRIFMVVRDFLTVLHMACREVRVLNERMTVSSGQKFAVPVIPNPVFDGLQGRRQYSSSDDESSSSL